MESSLENVTEADRLQAAITALRTEVTTLQQQIDTERRLSKSTKSVLLGWGKLFGACILSVFLFGMGSMEYLHDVVMREDFDPVARRLVTLESSSLGVVGRLKKLEETMSLVKKSIDDVSDEMRDFGSGMKELVVSQQRMAVMASKERYCTRLLGDYTKQLTEYTAKIRRKKPYYSRELEQCRIGREP